MALSVLDGNFYAMRNWHAGGGKYEVNDMILSFLGSLTKVIRSNDYGQKITIGWDGGSHRYRGFSDTYKGSREYDDSFKNLWESMNVMHEFLPRIGIGSIKFHGVEADDLGYYYARKALVTGEKTTLYSLDRDWLISVNANCSVIRPNTKDPEWTLEELSNHYQLNDNVDFLLYKSILGDGSDEIDGISDKPEIIAEIAESYVEGTVNEKYCKIIEDNMELMRLDRIVSDKEVVDSIVEQEKSIKYDTPIAQIIKELGIENAPGFLYGIFGKYQRVRKEEIVKEFLGK